MGGMGSIDASTQDRIRDTIKVVLTAFLEQYRRSYGKVLLEQARLKDEERRRNELLATSKIPPVSVSSLAAIQRLTTRPAYLSKASIMAGQMTKQGAIHKNWLERHFVVRADHCIEYYDTQLSYTSGQRPKGTIIPCGYTVNENDARQSRATLLAGKMGSAGEDLPPLPPLPANTFELYHETRRCYYIAAPSKAEKLKWIDIFRYCAWNSRNYTSKDPAFAKAFEAAVMRARRSLGHWSSWSFGGTEQEVLCDLVMSDLEESVLSDVYLSLKGTLPHKIKTRQQLLTKLVSLIMEEVNMAIAKLKGIAHIVSTDSKQLLDENIFAVDVTDREMKGQLRELADSLLIPWVGEHVTPVLPDILEVMASKVGAAFDEARYIFDSKIAGLFDTVRASDGKLIDTHQHLLTSLACNYEELRRVFEKLGEMEEPLIGFRASFRNIQPWSIIYTAQSCILKVLDNACYTYQEAVLKTIQEESLGNNPHLPVAKTRLKEVMLLVNSSTSEMLLDDSATSSVQFYKDTCLNIMKPSLMKTIYPAVKPVTDALAMSIPDSFKHVLYPEDLFEAMVDDVLCRRVEIALDAISQRAPLLAG